MRGGMVCAGVLVLGLGCGGAAPVVEERAGVQVHDSADGTGATSAAAADVLPDSVSREGALSVARDVMRVARYAALVTRDASGASVVRTIDPAPPDDALVVRFATNPRSRKVDQLAADPRVALYYFDAAAQRYATLYGRARLVTDSAERRARWHEGWTPFYPERERGAALYEVVPERLEVVSPGEGVVGDPGTWATPTLHFPRSAARPAP